MHAPPRRSTPWQLVLSAASDVGLVRARNEDAVYAASADSPTTTTSGWLGIVADGLGGRPAGHIASAVAIEAIVESFYRHPPGDPRHRLETAVEQANASIYRRSRETAEQSGMASTVTAAALTESRLVVAHVGDSRAYLLRDGELARLTRDLTVVEDLLRAGTLRPELAGSHPQRHVVTRALGVAQRVDVALTVVRVQVGDIVVLCTDGLHGAVSDADICTALSTPADAAALVARANRAGGRDHVAIVVARLVPVCPPTPQL